MKMRTALALLLSVAAGVFASATRPNPANACYFDNVDCREDCTECQDSTLGYQSCWACGGTCFTSGPIVLCG
jgi:hypothetical protein